MNAAVWFGAALFFTFGIAPTAGSSEMRELLGPKNFPYFSGAISHFLMARYFGLQVICGLIAFLHLGGEWLYLSKSRGRFHTGLLAALLLLGVLGGYWVEPRLTRLHTIAYAVNVSPAQRLQAQQSLSTWRTVYKSANFLILCGLGLYLWRVSNSPESTRFVSASTFRG